MLRLALDLRTYDEPTETHADGVSFALDRMGLARIPRHVEINCAHKTVTEAFWKAMLSFKRCRMTRIDHLVLNQFTDESLDALAKVLHDLDLEPDVIRMDQHTLSLKPVA